jgi:hypothetical protein
MSFAFSRLSFASGLLDPPQGVRESRMLRCKPD